MNHCGGCDNDCRDLRGGLPAEQCVGAECALAGGDACEAGRCSTTIVTCTAAEPDATSCDAICEAAGLRCEGTRSWARTYRSCTENVSYRFDEFLQFTDQPITGFAIYANGSLSYFERCGDQLGGRANNPRTMSVCPCVQAP
jgi:hypothetical protein